MSNSTQNKCPFCNSELISLVLPSNPPQYKTHCPNCENSKVSNSTQNDWAKRFDELFDYRHYDDQNEKWASILDRKDYNPASPEQIKDFIRKELADARRDERAYIIDLIQDEHNFTWVGVEGMCLIKDIVATLREEEKHG